ncbi:MAG: hypothetical protein ABF876_09820 [Acetobacter aceti]|uniref:Uncharacterized protein n=1 Tax=Acetobacter aceti TaxID=435 RepID=A0A1U9KHD9_ACEAC|nr:hypothetical protein A0U92_10495 [Acetobacter aceti]
MDHPLNINLVNAPCAAGKTYVALKKIAYAEEVSNQLTILAQPTVELCEESYKQSQSRYKMLVTSKVSSHSFDVASQLTITEDDNAFKQLLSTILTKNKQLRDPDFNETGITIITTHANLINLRLSGFNDLHEWVVVWDEVPGYTIQLPSKIPLTFQYIKDCFEIEDQTGECGLLKVINKKQLEDTLAADEVMNNGYHDFKNVLLADDIVDIHVDSQQYNNFVDLTDDSFSLKSLATLRPQFFGDTRETIIMGANITNSLIYKALFSDADFVKHKTSWEKELRFQKHDGSKVTIYYGYEGRWSQNKANKINIKSETYLQALVDAAANQWKGKQWAYLSNIEKTVKGKKRNQIKLPPLTRAHELPKKPYGFNKYSHIERIASFTALIPHPDFVSLFTAATGISIEEFLLANYYETVYQSLMRGTMRDPDNKNPKEFVLPDKDTADWLASEVFAGAKLVKFDLPDEAPKKSGRPTTGTAANATDRSRKRREKEKNELLKDLHDAQSLDFASYVFAGKFDKTGTPITDVNDVDLFSNQLKTFFDRETDDKHNNDLICPAMMDASRSTETSRGKDNVIAAKHIYLDIDDGDMRHEDFAAMFPKWRMIVYSTFSSTTAKPRWRVIIPTQDIMTAAIYERMAQHINKVLKRKGYHPKKDIDKAGKQGIWKCSGLDLSKLGPTNMMYLPVRNAAHPNE